MKSIKTQVSRISYFFKKKYGMRSIKAVSITRGAPANNRSTKKRFVR